MNKEKRESFSFCKDDFSREGLDLGIWEGLTKNLPIDTYQVDVIIVLRRKAC